MKQNFSKSCLTPQQHIALLNSRGLFISDELKAVSYLTNIGYFRLSAYFYPLLEYPKEEHRYKPGATFKKVMDMYRFDRKLRLLIFNEIEKIEVAIRSCITNYASTDFDNLFWLTNKSYFTHEAKFRTTLAVIDKELQSSKEDFISHFNATYQEEYPPAWMITEIIPFGSLAHIYMNLEDKKLKKRIAQYFGLQTPVFASWLIVLGGLRNMCCHHSRMWNRKLPISPTAPKHMKFGWIDSSLTDKRRMYYRISMIRYFLFTVSPSNRFKEKLKALLAAYPSIDVGAMGFPVDWENEDFWK